MAAFFIGRDFNARPVLPGAEMTGATFIHAGN
jgi:hypothetical protein